MVPLDGFVCFCLCTKLINGHSYHLLVVSAVSGIRHGRLGAISIKEGPSGQATRRCYSFTWISCSSERTEKDPRGGGRPPGHLTAGPLCYVTPQVLVNFSSHIKCYPRFTQLCSLSQTDQTGRASLDYITCKWARGGTGGADCRTSRSTGSMGSAPLHLQPLRSPFSPGTFYRKYGAYQMKVTRCIPTNTN